MGPVLECRCSCFEGSLLHLDPGLYTHLTRACGTTCHMELLESLKPNIEAYYIKAMMQQMRDYGQIWWYSLLLSQVQGLGSLGLTWEGRDCMCV